MLSMRNSHANHRVEDNCSLTGSKVFKAVFQNEIEMQNQVVKGKKKGGMFLPRLVEKGHLARMRHVICCPKTHTVKAMLS